MDRASRSIYFPEGKCLTEDEVPARRQLLAAGGDWEAEVDRLLGLGARYLRAADLGLVLLADPDGTEFRLRV